MGSGGDKDAVMNMLQAGQGMEKKEAKPRENSELWHKLANRQKELNRLRKTWWQTQNGTKGGQHPAPKDSVHQPKLEPNLPDSAGVKESAAGPKGWYSAI